MLVCISANPAIDRRLRLENIAVGEINRALSAQPFPGGKAAHVAMVAGVAGVLAFSLLLVLLLAFPFSGDVTVSNAPFKLGIVGQLSPVTGTPTPGCEGCSGPP